MSADARRPASRTGPSTGGLVGALAGAVIGGAAAAGAVGAGRVRSRIVRQRAELSEADAAHPSQLGMVPRGRESSVAADDGVRLSVEEIDPVTPGARAELTVVLVHGFALDRKCWHFQRRMLSELTDPAVRVVLYDQRRHGRSGQATARSCTIAQLAADLDSILRAVVPDGPIVLVGHSMGGMTIMGLAERNPRLFDRVAGVAFACTSAGDVMAGGLKQAVLSHRNPTVNVLGRFAHWQPAVADQVRRLAGNIIWACVQALSFGDRSTDPALVDLVNRTIAATPLDALTSFANTLSTHDRRAALAGLSRCEVLVIGGTEDRMIPWEHSEVIASELPGAELVALEGAGHMAMLEQPGEFDAALLELLRRCTDRSQVLRRLHPTQIGGAAARARRGLRRPRRRA